MAKNKLTLEEKLEGAIIKDTPYQIPKNWLWVRLEAIIKLISGRDVSAKQCNEEKKGIPYILGASNIKGGIFIAERWIENPVVIAKKKDILLSCKGTIGKTLIAEEEINISRQIMAIRCEGDIELKYIKFFVDSYVNTLIEQSKGLIPGITREDVLNIKVPVPPLKEQQRIVDKIESLFEKLDKAKELIEEARDNFEKRKSAILEKAFRGELTKEWRNRNLKANALIELENIKKINNRKYHVVENFYSKFEVPKSWVWTNLGQIIDLLSDYHSNGSYKVLKEKVELLDEPDYACMIRTTNFEKDNFSDLMKYITKDAYEHLSKSKLFGGEILINKIGNAGSVYYMPTLGKPASLAMNLFMLRINNNVNSKYIYYHLKSIYSTSDINQFVRGITTKTIDKKSINSLNIALPPLEEQKEVVRILDKLLEDESKIEDLTALEEQIELIKKSILAKAFRGQLGTNYKEDESALELLKEILSK